MAICSADGCSRREPCGPFCRDNGNFDNPTEKTITPKEVHPTHDVREEGILISDPVCQRCRASVHGSGHLLLVECKGSAPTIEQNSTVAAMADVQAERLRQINEEGWSLEHDDDHDTCELAAAAACYAYGEELEGSTGPIWPWDGGMPVKWPLDRRRELVKAGALILAEIERLDRAKAKEPRT